MGSFSAGFPRVHTDDLVVPLLAILVLALLLAVTMGLRLAQSRRRMRSRLIDAHSQIDDLRGRDSLTGLANRSEFEAALGDAVLACDREDASLAVLYVGLDSFQSINGAYGHAAGDELLAQTAVRLRHLADDGPVVSRLAGDEFALLKRGKLTDAMQLGERIQRAIQRPFVYEGSELRLTASVGVAIYPDHGSRPRLVPHAAAAMRTVKGAGGAACAHFDPAMVVDLREQAELLHDLRSALERGQLELYYQPKVDARSLEITAAEALLRWQHPRRGMVSPSVFIPLAERHGLIVRIGDWVIDEASRQAAEWRRLGLRMRVAINLSGHQLRNDELVPRLESALRRQGIPPERFTCEITESVAMEDTRLTREAFERLRAAGLHVSIDDFGTGYSSLGALRRLPAAELKIDRAFVVDLEGSAEAASIVKAIVQMAHTLGLRVVAEGVETVAQRDILVGLGCDELQGFLFARPMPASVLGLWADNESTLPDAATHPPFRASLFQPTCAAPLG